MTQKVDPGLELKDEALVLRQGDIVVLKADYRVTAEEADWLSTRLDALGIKAVVLGPGLSIERQSVEQDDQEDR